MNEQDMIDSFDEDGGYADWLYECWKDRHLDTWLAQKEEEERRQAQDVMSDYEKRVNAGVYE